MEPRQYCALEYQPQLIYERKELQGLSAVQNRKVFNLRPAFIYNPHTIKIIITAIYLNHSIYPEQSDLPVSAFTTAYFNQVVW